MTLHRQVSMAALSCGRGAQTGRNGMRASPASPESLCPVPSSLQALLDMASSPQPRRLGSWCSFSAWGWRSQAVGPSRAQAGLLRRRRRGAAGCILVPVFLRVPCVLTGRARSRCRVKMFTTLWMWREEYQHHEQLPLAFNGTWPSWNSDLDNRPW